MTPGEAGSAPTPRPGGAGPGRATAGNLDASARTVRRYMDFYAYRDQLKALSGVERHREIIRRMYGDLESATATTGRTP